MDRRNNVLDGESRSDESIHILEELQVGNAAFYFVHLLLLLLLLFRLTSTKPQA